MMGLKKPDNRLEREAVLLVGGSGLIFIEFNLIISDL